MIKIVLKEAYQDLADDFYSNYEVEDCSCHINPPCSCCTHEGHPSNLEETDDAWELIEE